MLLLPLFVLVLLVQPPRSLGAEMKTSSHHAVTSACTLVMCSPAENGLPGRDGRDGREGPRGQKGDPGTAGAMGLSWGGGMGIGVVTNPATLVILGGGFGDGNTLPWEGEIPQTLSPHLKQRFTGLQMTGCAEPPGASLHHPDSSPRI